MQYLWEYCFILTTTNGGINWFPHQPSSSNDFLWEVTYIDSNNIRIIGNNQPANSGTFIKSTDGGTTWIYRLISGGGLLGLSFSDLNTGTAVGYDGRIIKTTNGGTNWFAQSYGSRNDFYGTWFTDSENGVVVG